MKNDKVVSMSLLVDRAERALEAANRTYRQAVEELREGCPHAEVVEVELPRPLRDGHKDDSGRIRFCLDCGEKEHGRQFGGRYGLKASYFFVRLKAEPVAIRPEADLEKLLERLHQKGRFDEFDAKGAWRLGTDEGGFQRGAD